MNEKIKTLLVAITNNEQLQYWHHDGEWRSMDVADALSRLSLIARCIDDDSSDLLNHMRIKSKTIMIGTYEVPAPLKEAPLYGTTYWIACLSTVECVEEYTWTNDNFDRRVLNRNIAHSTRAAAAIHAAALWSISNHRG